jgi:transposase
VITLTELKLLDEAAKDALLLAQAEVIERQASQIDALAKSVEELKARLNLPPKTPDNSSKPPSQGQKADSERQAKAKSKVHRGAHRPLHPNPTRRRDVLADRCAHCHADVSGVAQAALHSYDRIEIPEIVPDVTRVVLHGGVCPCCAAKFKAAPPQGLEPGSPFGPNLRAFVLYLRFGQAIPFERLCRLLGDLFGLQISEGALANMMEDAAPAFQAQTNRIREQLLSGAAIASDETSVRVGKKTFWTWVFHHADSACFVIRPSRGKAVVAEFLGDVRPDFWISDRLGAQMGWASKGHQACLSHILRDIQYAIDAGDCAFAPGIKTLLKRAVAISRRRDRLKDTTLALYAAQLEARLDRLLQISPACEPGEKLVRMIKKFRQLLFVFITNRDVPPTNNGSEQALRPCVIFRKVTNCFRSQWGASLYADVRSVFETARRRGVPILQSIRLTLDGQTLDRLPLPVG